MNDAAGRSGVTRVQVDPVHRQRQQLGLGPVRVPAPLDDRVQHLRGSQVPQPGIDLERVVDGAGHDTQPRPDHRHFRPRNRRESCCPQGESRKISRPGEAGRRASVRVVSTRAPLRSARLNQRGARTRSARGCGWFRHGLRFAPPGSTNEARALIRAARECGWFRHGLRFAPPELNQRPENPGSTSGPRTPARPGAQTPAQPAAREDRIGQGPCRTAPGTGQPTVVRRPA